MVPPSPRYRELNHPIVFRLTHVARDKHVVREIAALAQVVTENRGGLELVGRDAKEALHLRRCRFMVRMRSAASDLLR